MDYQPPPFNPERLIHRRAIESNRVEFKATWDHRTERALVRTVCAFANDLLNLNGGYLVIGVEEDGGRPLLPPRGLDDLDLERLQKQIYGACARILPPYQPQVYPVDYQGRAIVVVWAAGGHARPYQAPDDQGRRWHWVRIGPQTVKAQGELQRQLLELTARIPFDDQPCRNATLGNLSPMLMDGYLTAIGSALAEPDQEPIEERDLYRKLRLLVQLNEHEVPRNVAVMFFHKDPRRFFPGAFIEVVQFADGAGGDVIAERTFEGPLPHQIHMALIYIRGLDGVLIRKFPDRPEAERTEAYPMTAVEEVLVNAVYHRGYDGPPEPVKVYFYPDRLVVTSYPGPVRGLEQEHFESPAQMPAVPARNRRIGELFKELKLAEAKGSGIPKIRRAMKRNGSPPARFEFDQDRTWFRVVLPIHPQHRPPEEADEGRQDRPRRQILLGTLVVTELVESSALLSRLGYERFVELMDGHDRLAGDLIARYRGQEIARIDGLLLLFRSVTDAVRFAVDLHRGLTGLAEEGTGVALRCRVGIHAGELILKENPPAAVAAGAARFDVEGGVTGIAARIASLAEGGQTLVTRSVADHARSSVAAPDPASALVWVSHGRYQLKEIPEPMEIFEVGEEETAPFTAPAGNEHVRRLDRGE